MNPLTLFFAILGLTGFALGQRLSNTDHRNNVEFQRAQCLGSHYRVGFTMVGTTL